jgi:hypothetical protein
MATSRIRRPRARRDAGISVAEPETGSTLLLFPILRRLLMLAAFLAIPLVAGELVARKLIGDAVAHAVQARIGVAPKVGFGSTPVLWQIVHGRLDSVSISATGAHIDGLPPLALRATLRDVHLRSLTGLEGAIGSLTIEATLPPAGVLDLLATRACIDALPRSALEGLTRNPRVDLFPGRIDLLGPRGRSFEVRLAPDVSGIDLRFEIIALIQGGVTASGAQLAAARERTTCSRSLGALPFGVTLASASVGAGDLELAFAGSDASFSALG